MGDPFAPLPDLLEAKLQGFEVFYGKTIIFVRGEKFKIMKDRKPKALLRFILLSFTYIACVSMGLYYWKRNATLLNLFLFAILGLSGLIFLMWSVSSNYIGLISNNSQLKEQLKTTTLPLIILLFFSIVGLLVMILFWREMLF